MTHFHLHPFHLISPKQFRRFFISHLKIRLGHYVRAITEGSYRKHGRKMEIIITFPCYHESISIDHIFGQIHIILFIVIREPYENQENHIGFGMDVEIYYPSSDIIIQVFLYCILYLLVSHNCRIINLADYKELFRQSGISVFFHHLISPFVKIQSSLLSCRYSI